MNAVRAFAWLALGLSAGCADAETSSGLVVTPATESSPATIQADWGYASGEVDVQVSLRTTLAEPCFSVGRVRIDKALDATEVYRTPDTACDRLRIEESGDIVLNDDGTGHDWSSEALDVDTDRERVRLGPWRDVERAITYELVLSAPPCEDDDRCECPQLERREDGERVLLELERTCE